MNRTASSTTVADLMRRDVVTVSRSTSIREVVELFQRHGISGMPVLDEDGKAVGMISETDLAWLMIRVAESGGYADDPAEAAVHLGEMTAAEVMTADVFGVPPDATLAELAAFFARTGLGRAAVLEDGELRGIVSVIDVLGVMTPEG
jgi:CBS domain-containing protein